MLKKIKHEDIYGLNGSPGMNAGPENAGVAAKKPALAYGIPIDNATKLDLRGAAGRPGPKSKPSRVERSLQKVVIETDNKLVTLGRHFQEQGEFAQAEDSFKKAIEHDPKNDILYTELGSFYTDQAKRSQAEDAFKKALELNPKNDATYISLGWLYRDQGKFPLAENTFKKALELNPKNYYAYSGLASLYRQPDQLPQAEEFYKKAVELDPENDRSFFALGRTYLNQGKFRQAEDSYRKALDLNPENDFVLFDLGGLYRKQRKFQEAAALFKKALVTFPQDERILGALASLYEELGRPELAREYAEKATMRSDYNVALTIYNYRKLKDILDRKGIKLVCAQYPMRNVGPLKRIFEKDSGVIFVDNESIFKKAVAQSGYKDYFKDMFAGDFGHCTQQGNELLAQNIADVILREVFNK
jgi:Tfp pilus assembly protein PilF